MKLESITVENYRQFENAKLTFDKGVTILAGANNSGKTSLIHLIKNIFVNDKTDYNMSDIPASNMQEWIVWAYPEFLEFFEKGRIRENVNQLVDLIIPQDETKTSHLMKTTCVKIHVSYDPKCDDFKLFANYLMDLDPEKHDFYFLYSYEVMRVKLAKAIINDFDKIKRRFDEIREKKGAETASEREKVNIEVKERHLKQMIVSLYVQSISPAVYYCNEDYKNKCQFEDVKEFRQLFNFWFIKASRPLDDEDSDHSHLLSKQMIKMVKLDDKWNELIERLPDEILNSIQEKEIDKTVRDTSLQSLKDTIAALEQTNGGRSGELMLDMQVTEDDISDLLQRITTATYDVGGYYLGESSQGLGYSNMIYIHLQLDEYRKSRSELKVNMFFLEEPESHMHPQMQQVFIKYLIDYCKDNLQGLITTHSNEMVRVAGISRLRVIRRGIGYKSNLHDLSVLSNKLDKFNKADDKTEKTEDKDLANFFDWFFEIGYSEIVFADKAIFYEGDTERLYIRKAMTSNSYKKLSQQYVAFIQVGGAYAKNYERLIRLLEIKSLIITDIDYEKDKIKTDDIVDSKITNATIKYFHRLRYPLDEQPFVKDLYEWKNRGENKIDDLIMVCFQTDEDGYARTLEEAMLNKLFSMDVSKTLTKEQWLEKKKESKLIFSIPGKKGDGKGISVRDILNSSSGNKTDFMYSVIMNEKVDAMMPKYIDGGLTWLME